MTLTDDQSKYLGIYLEDHAAGATAGSQRAARLAEAEAETADAQPLAAFAADVAEDVDALLALMETLGFEPSRVKSGLASAAERIGALKPNGHLSERSPLSTIIELEAMQMAVRGKRSLWETLTVAMPEPTAIDIDELIARADDQLALLSRLHADRTAATFAAPSQLPG